MKIIWMVLVCFVVFSQSLWAFETNDEQIDYVLDVVEKSPHLKKLKVLERLQWSTISDPRLYDTLERSILDNYQNSNLDDDVKKELAYKTRALGYSGNPKYQQTLKMLAEQGDNSRVSRAASRALKDFAYFNAVQQAIAKVPEMHPDWPSELRNYERLLKTNHAYAQRLAARAMFHEQHTQSALIALISGQLKQGYAVPDLDSLSQDTLAWYCKVLGQVGGHKDLLSEVAEQSPYRKIQKHADKNK